MATIDGTGPIPKPIEKIVTSGTIRNANRKINNPCFIPRLRGVGAENPRGLAPSGKDPPDRIISAVPVSKNPHREQKLVSIDTLSCPQVGQNMGLYRSSFSNNLVVLSVTLEGSRSLVSRQLPACGTP